jgi:hypothetical protein
VLVVVAGLGVWGLLTLAHGIFNPWGSSLTGGPTLTGYWAATVPVTPGQERQVAFKLGMLDGDCNRCVDGDGKMCGTGFKMDYDLFGHVKNYHGTKFDLSTGMDTNVPGTHLGAMKGTWAGGDEVAISMMVHVINADRATHSDEQPEAPVLFKMHRIAKADFQAACA